MNEREAIVATADRIAQRMGGRFVLNEDRPMTDKPELKPCPFCGATPHRGLGKVERCQRHGEPFQRFSVWCPHGHANITAMNEEQAYAAWNTRATPSQPDASALVEALVKHRPIVIEQVDSGMWSLVLRFSNAHVMRDTADALRAALSAWEAQHE